MTKLLLAHLPGYVVNVEAIDYIARSTAIPNSTTISFRNGHQIGVAVELQHVLEILRGKTEWEGRTTKPITLSNGMTLAPGSPVTFTRSKDGVTIGMSTFGSFTMPTVLAVETIDTGINAVAFHGSQATPSVNSDER